MVKAFVLISTKTKSPRNHILGDLKKITAVDKAYSSYGVYDFVTKVQTESIDKLKKIVFQRIRKIHNVRSTVTLMVNERIENR